MMVLTYNSDKKKSFLHNGAAPLLNPLAGKKFTPSPRLQAVLCAEDESIPTA